MNLDYKYLLPEQFDDSSRVWVYQSSRLFTISEALEIESLLKTFCMEWKSHGNDVLAYGNLFFGQFIILMADETQAGVSGCSTDASVRFIKDLETRFHVDLFNRTNLAFVIREKVQVLPLAQLKYAIEQHFIDEETLYFNNTILTKKDLLNNWIIPVQESWLAPRIKQNA